VITCYSAVFLSDEIRLSLFIPDKVAEAEPGTRRVDSAIVLLLTCAYIIFASLFHCRKCFRPPAAFVSVGLVKTT
jgi:hypothetical protein